MKDNILLIDDDFDTAQLVKTILKSHDVVFHHVLNGEEGLKLAYELQPNLIILDVMMPGLGGLEVCRRLREFSDVPILMLTAKSHSTDVERGFAAGADDYVKKPFSNQELLARIEYLLKHSNTGKSTTEKTNIKGYSDDIFKVDLIEQTVSLHGKEISLSPTEYKLLALLASHPHKTLTARRLLTEVWGATYSHDKELLSFYIHQLRQKIKEGEGSHQYICTQWGQGYWFNPLPRTPEPAPESTNSEQKGNQKFSFLALNNRWISIILAGLILLLLLVVFHEEVSLAFRDNPENGNTAVEAYITAEGFMEADLSGVRGQICVKNIGKYLTKNLSIVNTVHIYSKSKIRYISSAVDLREKPILAAGKSHCYPFGIALEPISGEDARYRVTTTVSITNHIGLEPASKLCPGAEQYRFGPEITTEFTFPEQ